ncbi:hypothetical protein ACFYVL_08250 [Streptomyces sp. NPDC004111]|uniref:hypothetical protein n=1 Tax=Streptomyces sp. NPDC004111 TaxID=3364690 RepID=UPI0036B312C3
MPEGLGFDKLLDDDGLFARLLGKTRSGRDRELLFGPDLPVLLLAGGPGMGKGRLLRCVREGFGPYVPTARVDCAPPVFRERVGEHTRSRSEATEALREMAVQFRAWRGAGGAFHTPRLYAGLVAVAASDPVAGASALVDEVRRHDDLMPPASFWRGVFSRAVRTYLAALGALVTHPVAGPLITALLDEMFARTSSGGTAALKSCYGEYPGAGGQPKLGLMSLAADFQHGGAEREKAEGFLFRALRDDLEASYVSAWGWLSRGGRPAALIDHADTPLGRRLIRPLLRDRESGHHDRMVVVASVRPAGGGRFLYPDASHRPAPARWSPAEGGLPSWSRPVGSDPELAPLWHGVLLLAMPLLTRKQQEDESARRRTRPSASRLRIDGGIHRLSGGRPLFVTRLAEAGASLELADDATDMALLDAPVRVGDDVAPRPVADQLLDELLTARLPEELPPAQHAHWLDTLSRLSVAHDTACAQTLMDSWQRGSDERLSAFRIAALLEDCGLPHCPRHFIGDFGVRHLLMRRLYGRGPEPAWQEAHLLLRDHYRARAEEVDAPRDALFGSATAHALNHHLACRRDEQVTDHLVRRMTSPTAEAGAWCDELVAIAQAPLLGPPDEVRARALGAVPVPGDAVRRRVDRLLHALRLCESFSGPLDAAVADTPRKMLDLLGGDWPQGAAVLDRRSRDWGARIAGHQPLRPGTTTCTCTRHLG